MVGWEGLENPQPKPQPLGSTLGDQEKESREPPIHWHGKFMPIIQKKRWDEGADWRFIFRGGQGANKSVQRNRSGNNTLAVLALRASGHSIKYIAKRISVSVRYVVESCAEYGAPNKYTVVTSQQDRAEQWGYWGSMEIAAHGRLEREHDAQWARLPIKKKDIEAMRARWIARHAAIKHTPEYRIRKFVRRQTYRLARAAKGEILRNRNMIEYLGCSYDHAIKHIESLLHDGWTWANHGKVWHIDHIVQLSDGSPYDDKHCRRVCHYTNLRPLAAVENLARPKGGYAWCRAGMKAS